MIGKIEIIYSQDKEKPVELKMDFDTALEIFRRLVEHADNKAGRLRSDEANYFSDLKYAILDKKGHQPQ